MNSVENITQKILDDASLIVTQNEQEANKEAEQILAQYKEEAKKVSAEILENANKEAAGVEGRILSQSELDGRKQRLSVKRDATVKAFDRALELMCSMPKADYISLLTKLCIKYMTADCKVILNAKDHGEIGGELIESIRTALKAAGKEYAVELSSDTKDIKGGLILSNGNIETNCTFEVTLKSIYDSLEKEVVHALFD